MHTGSDEEKPREWRVKKKQQSGMLWCLFFAFFFIKKMGTEVEKQRVNIFTKYSKSLRWIPSALPRTEDWGWKIIWISSQDISWREKAKYTFYDDEGVGVDGEFSPRQERTARHDNRDNNPKTNNGMVQCLLINNPVNSIYWNGTK